MNITLNGETKTTETTCSINDMLAANGYEGMLVAVAVNDSFVPKSQHANTMLHDGDRIDIVAPMQGG